MNAPSLHTKTLAAALLCSSALPSTAEERFNYDEAKVPPYTLPDPLVMADGTPVADAAMWRDKRRPELLELFCKHVYGRSPARPDDMTFVVESVDRKALDGRATRKNIRVRFTKRDDGPSMRIVLYLPAEAQKPSPVFVGILLFPNDEYPPQPGRSLAALVREEQAKRAAAAKKNQEKPALLDKLAVERSGTGIDENSLDDATRKMLAALPGEKLAEAILARGYGFATIDCVDLAPDVAAEYRAGVIGEFPMNEAAAAGEAWKAISAWAWGLSRAVDYFETDRDVDAKKVIVLGHSRRGKTALWAGAQDERFAIVISNNSGCGGAALSRRDFGETVARINRVFPHWFCDNFTRYNNNEAACPVDQHELIALSAPRPVYVASAVDDGWADPKGEFLAAVGAGPVYRLLGQQGLETNDLPAFNRPIGQTIGYHLRIGPHAMTDYDWLRYLDFADRHLK